MWIVNVVVIPWQLHSGKQQSYFKKSKIFGFFKLFFLLWSRDKLSWKGTAKANI